MSLDDHTAQQHLTPEERRGLLRAFTDRMLLKVTAMDDPEDMPGVEKAMRVAAVIERVYSRCDRAERQKHDAPDPRKLEAERAVNETAAIKARVNLANTLKWGEERRPDLGHWWDDAKNLTKAEIQTITKAQANRQAPDQVETPSRPQLSAAPDRPAAETALNSPPSWQKVTYVDLTDDIEAARAELALQRREARSAQVPPLNSG